MRTFALFFLAAVAAVAQPADVVITHAASHMLPQLPETGLAPGSLFEIYVPGEDAITLRFRAPGGAALVELPVVKSGDRFTGLVPAGTPPGEAEVVVSTGAGKTFTSRIWIAASNFGLFADAAQVWRDGPERARLTAPVLPGEWVTLWGTGLGNASDSTLAINVGGVPVAPSFAGPAPGQPGLDQINFQFPAGVPDDCYIPVTTTIAGRTSNPVVVPAAASPGPCHHRLGLGADDLATLDAGGQVPVSQTWVHSDVIFRPDAPSRYGRFDNVSLDIFQHSATGVQLVTGIRDSDTPREGCVLNGGGGIYGFLAVGRAFDSGGPEVVSPAGQRWPMEGQIAHFQAALSDPDQTYDLASVPPSALTPGDWAVEAPGGADIAAFRVPLRIAPPLRWLNRAALPRVGRSADLTLSWDPAGYTAGERVRASLSRGMNGISCEAPATAGSITIPASLIAQVPPDARGSAFATLLLVPSNVTPSLYSLPLKNGGAVRGLATFSYLESVTVTWE